MTVRDYIEQTIGHIRFLYYTYVQYFHTEPRDLLDMVDGVLFIDARHFIDTKAVKNGN